MSAVQFTRYRRPDEIWVEVPTIRGYGWTLWRQPGGYSARFVGAEVDHDGHSIDAMIVWEPNDPEGMAQIDDMNDLRLIRAAHADIIGHIAEETFGIANYGDITPAIRKRIINGEEG